MSEELLRDFHGTQLEEIKEVRTAIKELAEKPVASPTDVAKIQMMLNNIKLPAQDYTELKQYMRQLTAQSATVAQIAEIDKYIRKSVTPIVSSYNEWCGLVKDFVEVQLSERKPQTLIHKLDFTSWRVFFATLGSIVLSFVISIYAYNLHVENRRLSVNDLKYRYIKMVGDVDDAFIAEVEDYIYRDKSGKILDHIKKQVSAYEKTVAEKIRAEEQARLKREESASLDKQIQELKQK